jgi:hypothetical protein
VGNINQESFAKIWNGQKQRIIAKKLKRLTKDDVIFSMIGSDPTAKIGCYRVCDNLYRDLNIIKRIFESSSIERVFLLLIVNFLKIIKYFYRFGR